MPLRYAGCMKLLLKWLLAACALLLVAYLYPGVQVQSFGSALIAAAVVGIFYTLLRPLLVVLTLPLTIVTLGLFLLVVNAAMIGLTSWLSPGFHVAGFWAGCLAAIVTGLASWIGGMVLHDAQR